MNRLPRAFLIAAIMFACGNRAAARAPAPAQDLRAAQAAFDHGHYKRAIELWRSNLPALLRANDPRTTRVLDDIGTAYDNLADYPRALDAMRVALAHARAHNLRAREAGLLANIGIIETQLGRYDEALVAHQRALAIFRALKNRLGEANALKNLGVIEENLGRYPESLAAEQQAFAIETALKDRLGKANALNSIGIADEALGRYAQALASEREALAGYRALKDRLGEADALTNAGIAAKDLGRYRDALTSEEQALKIFRALKNQVGEANALTNLGLVEETLDRYEDALAAEHQAFAIEAALKNQLGEALVLTNVGIANEDLGRYADALDAEQRALALYRALKNQLAESDVLSDIGSVQEDLGRYDAALASEQEALAIDRAFKNRPGEAGVLDEIGLIEDDLGRYDDALASEQQALAIDRALNDRLGESEALNNIGVVEEDLGRYDDALASHRQSLAIDRAFENRLGEANALGNLGNVEDELGRFDDGLASHQQALAIDRALKNRLGEALDLANIGYAEENLGRYDDALAAAREAIELNAQISSPAGLWRSMRTEAKAEAHLGHRDEALAAYAAALEQIEGLRAGLKQRERSTFFDTTLFVYDEYIAYLLELNGQFPGQGYDRKALEILERKSARASLEEIGRSAAQHFKGVPPEIIAQENADGAAIAAAQNVLAKVRSAGSGDSKAESLAETDLADARTRAATHESSIRTQYPAYYQLRHPQPLLVECGQSPCLTIASFQQSVLKPGELMLVYDLLADKSVLWLIDRDHVALVSLAGSEKIDAAVAALGTHLSGMVRLVSGLQTGVRAAEKLERSAATDLPAFTADSYALYRMLLPDAATAALARAKSLIVIPSGSLYRLAFETLVTQDPEKTSQPHYLIEDAPLSYMPSASLLAVVRSSYAQPTAGRNPLLAFANPAFGTTSPGSERGLSSYGQLQLAAVRSVVRGNEPSAVSDALFPPLPGTQTEADAVRSALEAPSESLIVGDAATRERLLSLNKMDRLKAYQYLLFATHAVLPSEIKGLTQPAIVLAHPERGDGLLTMADVFGLSLDADFVMLSACDTGVQTADSSGEGISGFTRAFLYAGTPAISVTLWEVDDAAAPQITPPFFAGMHAGKLTPAESLRQAKLAMLTSPEARFRHPYAWAPGVIFGDGDRDSSP